MIVSGRMIVSALAGIGVIGGLVWMLWPDPQAVDLAPAWRGQMQISLTGEGIARVREPYMIAAPIAGTTTRSPVQVGDRVEQGATVVAVIQPADPALMDVRTRAQAQAAVTEAEAALSLADTRIASADSALAHAESQYERGQALAASGTISQRMLEDLQQAVTTARQNVEGAQAERNLARAALLRAQAQLLGPETQFLPNGDANECCVQIRAPLTGTVLSVTDRNARPVSAGTPLLSIGDVTDLEIEIDLLSTDAPRVAQGATALVERWGGAAALDARVRRVEPAAFTRVSALGIEEQRVRVHLDLLSPPEDRPGLGDQFRVLARIILSDREDVLQIPQSALFRHEGGWAVFRAENGRAVLSLVEIGQQARETTEILSGLSTGDHVVLFPPSNLSDGARIAGR